MISVVVCTRDRAASLSRTLQSLGDMATPVSLEWELLVVDNGSRDHTRDVVTGFARVSPSRVRYLFEGRPGLSSARNAGGRAARGDVIAFTDDDCLVDRHWLACIDGEFRADPSLAIVGGRVELHDPRDQPVSVRAHRERVLVRSFRDIASLMIGCNMSCRKTVLAEMGYFDVRFGSGAPIPSAEDWDFLYKAYKAGAKIVFSPDVLLYHDHGRRSEAEVEPLNRAYIIGRWAFYCKHSASLDVELAKSAARELWWLVGSRQHRRRLIPVALGMTYWFRALVRTNAVRERAG